MAGKRWPGQWIRPVGVEVLPEMVEAEPRVRRLCEYRESSEHLLHAMRDDQGLECCPQLARNRLSLILPPHANGSGRPPVLPHWLLLDNRDFWLDTGPRSKVQGPRSSRETVVLYSRGCREARVQCVLGGMVYPLMFLPVC